MTDKKAFDRQLAREIDHLAGPDPRVDVSDVVAQAAQATTRPRLAWLTGSLRLATATAGIAVLGVVLVLGLMDGGDRNAIVPPGAMPSPSTSPSPSEGTTIAVTGTWLGPDRQDCQTELGPTEEDELLTSKTLCAGLRFITDDPRLGGEGTVTRREFADRDPDWAEEWVLVNEDGSWTARRSHDHDRFAFLGGGGHAGMSAVVTLADDGTLTGFLQPKRPSEEPTIAPSGS